jgi:drug/metabolite transporter (DMT)-like permease
MIPRSRVRGAEVRLRAASRTLAVTMQDANARASPALGSALIALLCMIWGSTWIVIQRGLAHLPPFTSAAARFLLAAVAMTAAARALYRREGGRAPTLGLSIAVGVCNFGASYGLVYWGETRVPSGLASLLWSTFPIYMAIAGHFWLHGERLGARQWSGFCLGFVGVAFLFVTDIRRLGHDTIAPALCLCCSPLSSAIGTTLLKRHGSGVSSVRLNRDAMWIGALLLCAAAFATEQEARVEWNRAALGTVIYLALVGTTLTFGLYFWLLRQMPAHKLSLISYVTPAIALCLGTLFGGEPFTAFTAIGSALILGGVWLVVRARARPMLAEAAKPRS